MELRKGIAISPGVAIAPAVIPEAEEYRIHRRSIATKETSRESDRAERAIQLSVEQLDSQRDQVATTLGRDTAAIFDWHIGLLRDPRLFQQIQEAIRKRHFTAAYAIATVMRQYHRRFLSISDPVIAQREKDVTDIERRLMRNVLGDAGEDLEHLSEDSVLVSHDLTPSQAVQLANTHVAGIVTDIGGQTSHTAIVAKSLGIPAVMGLTGITDVVSGGDTVIVDGTH
ncbi:MAG: phosphoenolpyruvate-utilizing N-terminal domain-containing protein, partial [Phycisphaerae bacterium]